MGRRKRKGVDTWGAIRSMVTPVYERYRTRFPSSKRLPLLERMHAAALAEDADVLVYYGAEYFRLTSVVPPGCYAYCPQREERYFLEGARVGGRKTAEHWSIHPYNYQVWR